VDTRVSSSASSEVWDGSAPHPASAARETEKAQSTERYEHRIGVLFFSLRIVGGASLPLRVVRVSGILSAV
jgi:hypothetical protein